MKVIWTGPAEQERWEIIAYLESKNPEAALALDERISNAAQRINQFPHSGRIGRISGTREIIIGNYVLVYEIRGNLLLITHVVHGARKFPPS